MTDEKGTGYYLWRCTNLWLRNLDAAVSELGLSNTQFIILFGLEQLSAVGEPVTQMRLARERGVNVNVVSKAVRSLEKKGYLLRRNSQTDTRAKNLDLTEKGKKTLSKAKSIVTDTANQFFSPIGNTTQLIKLLKTLLFANE
jgi:DNA-binding MarR family transcriptional regulator